MTFNWRLRSLSNCWKSWTPQIPENQAGTTQGTELLKLDGKQEIGMSRSCSNFKKSDPTSMLGLVWLLEDVGVLQPDDGCAGDSCLLGVAGDGGVLGFTRG